MTGKLSDEAIAAAAEAIDQEHYENQGRHIERWARDIAILALEAAWPFMPALAPVTGENAGEIRRALEAALTPDAASERIADLLSELNAVTAERDKAYRERARLVAFLAAVYPAEITPAESDSGAWFLVFVTTPAGQMSWHLHEDDLDLFEHLLNKPETGIAWDGHTTDEKHKRLEALTAVVARKGPQSELTVKEG